MIAIVDTGTVTPGLVCDKTELSARSGGLLRAVATGAIVRVDDCNIDAEACLMIGPALIPEVLRYLGIDPAVFPPPGRVRDDPVPAEA